MIALLTLWTHTLVALIFGAALAQRVTGSGLPRRAFAVALASTGLWALAVAGIDAGDLAARLAESVRDIAWLGFMLALVRRGRVNGWGVALVYGVVMLVTAAATLLAMAASVVRQPATLADVTATMVLLRMMTAVSALVLMRDLLLGGGGARAGGLRLVALALAGMWATDLLLFSADYMIPGSSDVLAAMRGVAMIPIALLAWTGARKGGDWAVSISRAVAVRSVVAVALALYVGAVLLVTALAGRVWGEGARIAQTAIVFGATAALVTLASTPWLRSWIGVMVAKHLFRHRYDYRAEWQRFAETLGRPGEGAPPLTTRIVKAVAEMTGSPAGLLLLVEGGGLVPRQGWSWDMDVAPEGDGDEAIARHLCTTQRIVELDQIRADSRGDRVPAEEAAAVPQWMIDRPDAWALVPLLHAEALVGAILLARPLVDRSLDWEDLDLLRVAGRQAASYLAEDRAHAALADAHRFDEFNRRFAFIMHDIKNLASQLSLVARNAERHADNPAFRADMIETLRGSSDRMTMLLARLSQRALPPDEPVGAVDASALAARLAAERKAGHPIAARATGPVWVRAQSGRLEQVLRQLIQNAAEASDAGEPVLLSTGQRDGEAWVEVADHGCGMSPAFVRDELFRPFVSTKAGGFGLGAHEARQLVEAMNGRLSVTSREGEGTRFRIVLPVAVGPAGLGPAGLGSATLEAAA
ncbi:multi-sensor signal transduction histidine kinase [Sphingomonas gellani]|uniref:histidine kinase n=1 Tax=Sphingomonas gellani TaxID=1166340 RepID=A0A1H8G070_9SPHN|nr:XrtA/PEP-CTERM system histidine kinase PrsK [Sphingomonas gellani]SEN37184.1 multi-sensor signal transduction histidine kinase [Sphingomonas gellani]